MFSGAPGPHSFLLNLSSHSAPLIGNKRTGLACALVFLELNRASLSDPEGTLYDTIMQTATGALDKPGLAKILQSLPPA